MNNKNEAHEIRVLLDSASQSNFITESMCKILNLKPDKVNLSVKGINNANSSITERVQITIKSQHNNYQKTLTCFVIPVILNNLPLQSVQIKQLKIPPNLKLADPTFNQSGTIDLLIGAGLFYDLLCIGQIKEKHSPTLQKTRLGWVVSGSYSHSPLTDNSETNSYLTLNDLHQAIERFWNQEELKSDKRLLSNEEQYCETLFQTTTTRDEAGHFVVRIPFKNNLHEIGDSKHVAHKRFVSLERRLNNDVNLKNQYTAFMDEYNLLNHMTKVVQVTEDGFYLPHHAVVNQASETTKLRVVFDGSCKLEEGLSINETQCTGPTIQDDLVSIIARFRSYQYVITADIAKMYRQVMIHPEDRKYQRIFWRSQPSEELSTFALNTVTYGTTAAPFLAVRALIQLAKENELYYPAESQIIKQDFYVDDLLTGSDSVEELTSIKTNIINILKSGGFDLRKWTSNIEELGDHKICSESKTIQITEKVQKTLGVYWNPRSDEFSYSVNINKPQDQVTKRTILAITAQLFDPVGLLAPTVIIAKFILQDIWKLNIGWDETIPMDLHTRWLSFKDKLKYLNHIKIQRHAIIPNHIHVEIHSFADASEQGYGACVYLKSINAHQESQVTLFTAKSKVAPIKLVTLPRLELCAAVISAQLVSKVKSMLKININKEYYWSDSQITLCWIKSDANKYNTYVANRITEIQSHTHPEDWYHVRSQENPADLISRGILPDKLVNLKLWWLGPTWLEDLPDSSVEQQIETTCNDLPEQRKNPKVHSFILTNSTHRFAIENYSSFLKLKRIIAYCLRFAYNSSPKTTDKRVSSLMVEEIANAETLLIKQTQNECFHEELQNLNTNTELNPKSKLLPLSPFLDPVGIIRVGGRLEESDFSYDKKHPIILPSKHHLTTLIFRQQHQELLHAGSKLLLNSIREQYWPLNGRIIARKTVRECVKCIRYQAKSVSQFMGNLPRNRTIMMPPFHVTGLDYGGPFYVKDRQGRGSKVTKSYLALFICFSTKCLHLELVSDLTTQSFIAALRRFIGRRGKPAHIYSDNGTTFVGANNELQALGNFINEEATNIQNNASQLGIQWHFIPPYAPNFGGLWEAGIKSSKFHIKRVVGETPLTYESFSTLLIQIESILNSRPLTPLTSDPNDIEALTPAHFLIGRQFTTIPDPDVRDIQCSRLNRYEQLQQINQRFWDQWSKSYIAELQQRYKWTTNQAQLEVGTLVIIKDDTSSPARWHLGRITALHPGKDKLVRVVSVKCKNSEIKRAINKICVLLINDNSA